MEQSQNVHVIYRVRPEALKERVVVVDVDVSHTTSHPELLVVDATHGSLALKAYQQNLYLQYYY